MPLRREKPLLRLTIAGSFAANVPPDFVVAKRLTPSCAWGVFLFLPDILIAKCAMARAYLVGADPEAPPRSWKLPATGSFGADAQADKAIKIIPKTSFRIHPSFAADSQGADLRYCLADRF